ncbi:uncharacterized protein [Physcomitrium patens]|nr:tip elongation aberrant protein 1-like isoform X2 [Physcomitrium patens]|eukprot:XP_024379765.1 tip elongation aberrant protein 1-like isoform X2 [Physcomitrella patens]
MTSAEMVKEANGLAKRVVSSFESRYGGRKVSTRIVRARQNSRAEDRKRDGFPRGFSTVSSNSRLCRMVSGDGLGGDGDREDSSRSIILSFDVEQMGLGIVDESPVYGDRSGLTPENGSFHLNPKNDVVRSDSSDGGEVRLDARLSGATSKKDGRRRRIFSKRRKSAAEKVTPDDGLPIRNHLRADFDSEAERAHGTECDVFTASRLLAKPQATRDEYVSNYSTPLDARAQMNNSGVDDVYDAQGWNNLNTRGKKPEPRYFHAAAVVGRRMVVVGGQTGSGPSNDVQVLHFSKMMWSELGRDTPVAKGRATTLKSATPGRMPLCRGHSLISWGKTVLLIGGEMNPASDKVEVWSFDLETECWSKIAAKGEIPTARSGQSVTRAGSILIMFGGETPKGQKLNDLHILDLKSLMWLPLNTVSTGPSPRSKHCATMYDDRFLLIFGGSSKSKYLDDVCALDFETVEWSKMKTKGIDPSPRSGHASILVGDKWYIAGGETRGHGSLETLMLDVSNLTWSAVAGTTANTTVANQGLSLVLVQRKEKTMLVAFGGKGSELSNQVQVLSVVPLDHVKTSSYSGNSATTPSMAGSGLSCVNLAKTQLDTLEEEQYGSRASQGNSPVIESFNSTDIVPLRRRYSTKLDGTRQPPGEILSRVLRETPSHEIPSPLQHKCKVPNMQSKELEMRDKLASIVTRNSKSARWHGSSSRRKGSFDSGILTSVNESAAYVGSSRKGSWLNADLSIRSKSYISDRSDYSLYTAPQSQRWEGEVECSDGQLLADLQDAVTMERRIHLINKYRQSFEMKLAAAVRRAEQAEGQVTTALRAKEEIANRLASALKMRQHAEGQLAAALTAQAELKETVAAAERAQEDSNNLCSVVHSENLRLEHDLAFLKAVLEDTQKELDSTREGLVTERSKSFKLQMEIFDLKKKTLLSLSEEDATPNSASQPLPASEIA